MPDFNKAPPQGSGYDRDLIASALRLCAYRWVPEIFVQGRMASEKGHRVLRCADISGRPPRDRGSCVIQVEGDHAGDWVDFDNKDALKGGPISTLKEHFKVPDGKALEFAIGVCDEYGCGEYARGIKPLPNGSGKPHANGNGNGKSNPHEAWINDYLACSVPLAGTLGETYWNNRKLGPLPPAAFGSYEGPADLLFNPAASHFEHKMVYPALIARFRFPWDYSWTGAIHRVYLKQDASWHIGGDKSKLTLGDHDWGVIMLAPINEAGELCVGEGIETTAAGMFRYGVPGWAVTSNDGMDKLAGAIYHGRLAVPIRRLLVLADRGRAGERSARNLATIARNAGIVTEYYLPRGDDDHAADLAAGLPPAEPILDFEGTAGDGPGLPLLPAAPVASGGSIADIERRLMAVERGIGGDAVNALISEIVALRLDAVNEDRLFGILWRKSGVTKAAIKEIARHYKGATRRSSRNDNRPWLDKLAVGNDGEPRPIMSNVATIFREAEDIKGTIGFNEFTGALWVLRKFPWEYGAGNPCDRSWTDDDELAALEWMQATAGVHARKGDVFDAVRRVASENKFHPVRDMLDAIPWDTVARLGTWVVRYLGAEDNLYNREIGARWLLSAVARVYHPGVKADCMVVLEGPQGARKSSAIRTIFDPWFTDQLSEIGTKDASLELRGIWCAEWSELDNMTKPEASRIKSYMSRQDDYFRPPYGRVPLKVQRQNVFAGTCNDDEYLKDESGNRRFWPIVCGNIDIAALHADRYQLLAEAVFYYKSQKAKWWIDGADPELQALVAEETEARYQRDAWESVISKWLNDNEGQKVKWYIDGGQTLSVTTSGDILEHALGINDKTRWSRNDQMRVGKIMRRLQWKKRRLRMFNIPPDWYYVRARDA